LLRVFRHCKHYIGRGVMRKFADAGALAKEMRVAPAALAATFAEYNKAAESGGADPHGRKFFTNAPFRTTEELHVAIITPVVHCTCCCVRAACQLRL
jgi:hypothetical protein